jgi:large subunit ribosomal protein L29
VKIKEIRKMKNEDLDKRLSELRLELGKELGSAKMGRAMKNPGKIKQVRKSIAQILTIKRELALSRPSPKLSESKKPSKTEKKPK